MDPPSVQFLRASINFDTVPLLEVIVIGLAVLLVYYLTIRGFTKLKSLCWDTLTISFELSRPIDRTCGSVYGHLMDWLLENMAQSQSHTELISKTDESDSGKVTTELKRQPAFGVSDFKYRNCWFRAERLRLTDLIVDNTSSESIKLTTYRWNAGIVDDILTEVKAKFRVENEDKTQFYFANNGYWDAFGKGKKKRPVSTVILSEATEAKFLSDVKDFLASEEWYSERGIPYRRGYLLYGPPGCGKSSLIKAIAGELSYDICMMSLSSRSLTDDMLNALMNTTPDRCIVVMEDIDAAFTNREELNNNDTDEKCLKSNPAYNGNNTVTFSGLLNTLDGVASTEGRIIILTTNYVERLDPALARPGRVDLKLLVDYPTDDQLRRMFARFYKDSSEELATRFVNTIRDLSKSVSMAACQGLFMMHKESPEAALDDAKQYFQEQCFAIEGKTSAKIQAMYM